LEKDFEILIYTTELGNAFSFKNFLLQYSSTDSLIDIGIFSILIPLLGKYTSQNVAGSPVVQAFEYPLPV
jgi:hypothetical protein